MQTVSHWFRKRKKSIRHIWRFVRYNSTLMLLLLLMLIVMALHTALFYIFEKSVQDVTIFDAFWVTMTTITTVGYGDISAKTVEGRLVTIFFGYLTGLGLFAWLASEWVGRLLERIEKRRRGMLSVNWESHIVIINFPSPQKVRLLLEQIRSDPSTQNTPIILINQCIESVPFEFEHLGFVRGDVTDPETYHRAAITKASKAIVLAADPETSTTDALTSAIVTTLEYLNPGMKTIAECVFKKHLPLFHHLRCKNILFTGDFVVKMIVQEFLEEGTTHVFSRLLDRREGNELYSYAIPKSMEQCTFREIIQFFLQMEQRILPIGFMRGKEMNINPSRDIQLKLEDRLLFLSKNRPDWTSMCVELESIKKTQMPSL